MIEICSWVVVTDQRKKSTAQLAQLIKPQMILKIVLNPQRFGANSRFKVYHYQESTKTLVDLTPDKEHYLNIIDNLFGFTNHKKPHAVYIHPSVVFGTVEIPNPMLKAE